ncbi:MAG TPA: hypothetical protein GX708_20600 [Gallicola sp.]|nr:hypothetical protein [Gallicola sp.]
MKNIKFAIEYLKNNSYKMAEENNNYAVQTLNMAISALEKQIPKKPIENGSLPNIRYKYSCPTCNRFWDKEFMSDYCSSCGQRFDLSEIDIKR